jgi:hypothetical protein
MLSWPGTGTLVKSGGVKLVWSCFILQLCDFEYMY